MQGLKARHVRSFKSVSMTQCLRRIQRPTTLQVVSFLHWQKCRRSGQSSVDPPGQDSDFPAIVRLGSECCVPARPTTADFCDITVQVFFWAEREPALPS